MAINKQLSKTAFWFRSSLIAPAKLDNTSEDMFSVNGGRSRLNSSDDHSFSSNSTKIITSNDISCSERIGAKMEQWLETTFATWGRFCAGHPVVVLGVGLVVSCAFVAGLTMFQVTTDPVELWSAPDSRARQERKYFNDHFTWVV